jgi:branched-chain amino acid transport system ATP-binding protein
VASGGMSVDEIYAMFPNLKERRSQGTRCRAASSRCWRWRASCAPARRLLLLDEISEGLAPVIVQKLGEAIRTLRERASPSCWSSRTSASPRRWPTALRHRARPVIEADSPTTNWKQKMDMLHEYLGV